MASQYNNKMFGIFDSSEAFLPHFCTESDDSADNTTDKAECPSKTFRVTPSQEALPEWSVLVGQLGVSGPKQLRQQSHHC